MTERKMLLQPSDPSIVHMFAQWLIILCASPVSQFNRRRFEYIASPLLSNIPYHSYCKKKTFFFHFNTLEYYQKHIPFIPTVYSMNVDDEEKNTFNQFPPTYYLIELPGWWRGENKINKKEINFPIYPGTICHHNEHSTWLHCLFSIFYNQSLI